MLAELGVLLLDINFVISVVLLLIYYILDARALVKVIALLLLIGVFSHFIHAPLLSLENAKSFWYLAWASISGFGIYLMMKVTKEAPHIQKITIPIALLTLIAVFIEIGRHFERNVTGTDYLKEVYGKGQPIINWLITGYTFAPLALLLVKSIRKRLDLKR